VLPARIKCVAMSPAYLKASISSAALVNNSNVRVTLAPTITFVEDNTVFLVPLCCSHLCTLGRDPHTCRFLLTSTNELDRYFHALLSETKKCGPDAVFPPTNRYLIPEEVNREMASNSVTIDVGRTHSCPLFRRKYKWMVSAQLSNSLDSLLHFPGDLEPDLQG